MKEITTKVYTFDELNETAKEKAREWAREGIADYNWWDGQIEPDISNAVKSLHDAGIYVDERGISFDLDRGAYLYFSKFNTTRKTEGGHEIKSEHQGIWCEDAGKLATALLHDKIISKEYAKAIKNGDLYPQIDTQYYGGGSCKNHLYIHASTDAGYEIDDKTTSDIADAIDDWLGDKLEGLWVELQREYEAMYEDEYVDDHIKANEYTFTSDGERFG